MLPHGVRQSEKEAGTVGGANTLWPVWSKRAEDSHEFGGEPQCIISVVFFSLDLSFYVLT
jgi:hypothetical protein